MQCASYLCNPDNLWTIIISKMLIGSDNYVVMLVLCNYGCDHVCEPHASVCLESSNVNTWIHSD